MNSIAQFDQGSHGQVFVRGMGEDRASGSRSKHEGESSHALCDRLSRTRDFSRRQLPTDQDYAVSTREYQTDQSSLKPAPAAACPVLDKRRKQRQKQPHRCAGVDRVTPYQSILGQAGMKTQLRRPPGAEEADEAKKSDCRVGRVPIFLHKLINFDAL